MRIVLIHRYFWPDTSPYGILLRRIAEHLADDGNEVTVFTGEPTYGKESDSQPVEFSQQLGERLSVRRVRLFSERRLRSVFRAINDLMFCMRIIFHVLRHRPKIVMCSTQPPVIGAAASGWAARRVGAKFIYHLQDIHPEVICETGHVRRTWIMRLLERIDKRTARRADRVVVLSDDMRQSMVDRDSKNSGQPSDQLSVIPNFNLPRFGDAETPAAELTKAPGQFRLMFAGNIGRFQNLDAIVQACLDIPTSVKFEFVLLGDGKAKDDLREQAAEANDDRIIFIPRQPLSIAEPLMAESDLCVVSLEEKVYQYAFPSKLASYLSLGAAVLIVCEKQSQLCQIAVKNEFGLAAAQAPVDDIQKQIRWAIEHPEEIAKMRVNAAKFFDQNYALPQVLPQWTRLIAELS